MAGLVLKSRTKTRAKYILILLIISAVGGLIDMLPQQLPPARFYELIGQFLATPSTGLTWLFIMSLLNDDFRINIKSILVLLMSSAIPFMYFLTHVDILPSTSSFYWHFHMPVIVGIVLHIVWVVVTGFKDDLIGLRRQARVWLIAIPTSLIITSVVAEYTVSEEVQIVVNLIAEFIGVSLLFLLLASFKDRFLDFSIPNEETLQAATQDDVNIPKIQTKDKVAFERLMALMNKEKAYLDADLSVNSLADKVGIPAHQLRVIINQGLGYKNFSAFLAHYRIIQIKVALEDPEKARIPILSIALNNGFSSLATFNRLFKNEVGIAAGEYRKQSLSK